MKAKTIEGEEKHRTSDDELAMHLDLLYEAAWARAPKNEQDALRHAAGIKGEPSPGMIFSAIAQQPKQLDPKLATILFRELGIELNMRRMELDDVPLSDGVAHALQMAFAYELGQRIDRVLADIGASQGETMTQEALEARAEAYGVPWQVVSYALTRGQEGNRP